jgi:hypothetical protein
MSRVSYERKKGGFFNMDERSIATGLIEFALAVHDTGESGHLALTDSRGLADNGLTVEPEESIPSQLAEAAFTLRLRPPLRVEGGAL